MCLSFLANVAKLITIKLKFIQNFSTLIFGTETYQNRFIHYFESNFRFMFLEKVFIRFFTLLKSQKSAKTARKQTADTLKKSDLVQLIESQNTQPETFTELITEVFTVAVQQTRNNFDFSVATSLSFLLAYLTLGAVASSSLFSVPFVDSYYFLLIFLSKIDLTFIKTCDSTIQIENNLIGCMILSAFCAYLLVGICLTALVVQRINSEIKFILFENTKQSILKLISLLNQFGYEVELDSFSFEFSTTSAHHYHDDRAKNLLDFNLDADELLDLTLKCSPNSLAARRASRLKRTELFDKQTQITTLLCSKLIKVTEFFFFHKF